MQDAAVTGFLLLLGGDRSVVHCGHFYPLLLARSKQKRKKTKKKFDLLADAGIFVSMNLALPKALADKIRPIAKREKRSVTGQIVYWLEIALEKEKETKPQTHTSK